MKLPEKLFDLTKLNVSKIQYELCAGEENANVRSWNMVTNGEIPAPDVIFLPVQFETTLC
jgi:hypothetical protein